MSQIRTRKKFCDLVDLFVKYSILVCELHTEEQLNVKGLDDPRLSIRDFRQRRRLQLLALISQYIIFGSTYIRCHCLRYFAVSNRHAKGS